MVPPNHNNASIQPATIPSSTPLLFDMDGTILDNMVVHHRAWQELLRELGKELTLQEVQDQIWGKNEEIFERVFPGKFSKEEVLGLADRKERRYIDLYRDEIRMLPGLERFLTAAVAAGCPLAIATAAPPICVDFVCAALRLDRFFSAIVHGDSVQRSKPAPDPYLKAAELLGVEPSRCIVFEDAPVGVRAAQSAGMQAYVILTTHKREEFLGFSNVCGLLRDFEGMEVA